MSTFILTDLLLEFIQGDDYKAADNRAITIAGRGVTWPTVLSSVKLYVYETPAACAASVALPCPAPVLEITGTYTPGAAEAPPSAAFDVPRADTLKLVAGVRRYLFEVRGLFASGSVTTLARGLVTTLPSGL